MSGFVHTDERLDVLASLEQCALSLIETKSSDRAWKWADHRAGGLPSALRIRGPLRVPGGILPATRLAIERKRLAVSGAPCGDSPASTVAGFGSGLHR